MHTDSPFTISFRWQDQVFIGSIYVYHLPGLYYFTLFIEEEERLFFVDDEQDRWIENNVGSSPLAKTVGAAIDRHYHPDLHSDNSSNNPDQSPLFR